ncbi:hypothetical protein N5D52_00195 [Pseudomonas sp. GD03860]|uniref:hypothetical protein n=1 Tax=Pseudomonas TaxID=286 RepID=UPI002363CF39|nr:MULTISPECIES: hypothetical protein [Pseudomonas]MDD2060967.1 hypothetical protein [Pseudomonas putida]MDH0635346.1 hypothetical protein [Pseudomonas sp. GD03860]
MKEFVIGVNNLILYCVLAGVWVGAGVMFFILGVWPALGMLVGGTIAWFIISGVWFVQAASFEELKKLNAKS